MKCGMLFFFFFFKQKTAYEILTCDWSSDVCSSDLLLLLNVFDDIKGPIMTFPLKSYEHECIVLSKAING